MLAAALTTASESRLLTSSRAYTYGCSWVCSCCHFASLYEAKTLSCAVMQEWQKLGAEYVASKHYAVLLHRLAAMLQVLHRLSIVFACTVQMLHVGLSVWHSILPTFTQNAQCESKSYIDRQTSLAVLCFAPASDVTAPIFLKVLLVAKALLSLTAPATACPTTKLPACMCRSWHLDKLDNRRGDFHNT